MSVSLVNMDVAHIWVRTKTKVVVTEDFLTAGRCELKRETAVNCEIMFPKSMS